MDNLSKTLWDVSVLLIILAMCLAFVRPGVNAILGQTRPEATNARERRKFNRKAGFILFVKLIPILFVCTAVSYVSVPDALTILSQSKFDFSDFDVLKIVFVAVVTGVLVFAVYTAIQSVRLIVKLAK